MFELLSISFKLNISKRLENWKAHDVLTDVAADNRAWLSIDYMIAFFVLLQYNGNCPANLSRHLSIIFALQIETYYTDKTSLLQLI